MGVFAQVGLLLWKNAKLRIRSPLLTVTTLFWPIVIFIIIAVIRTRIPPAPTKECHFKPQALPSVGTTDFLQSMMCDIETKCLKEDQVPKSNEPPIHGASIGLLLDDLEPLFSNGSSLVNDLESLPETLGPLLNLTQTLEDIFDMISEQNFYLGDFFMNQTRMKELLLLNFEGAELDLIETLLDARVNVLEVLDVIGYSDSGSLICNATLLQTYVIFPPNTNVENIANALCKLTREDTENIINIILEELDVHYIADEVNSFLRALDRYGLDNFTRDVLDIREQLENITALGDFVDILPQLIQLTRLVPDVQRFLEAIQGGSVDQTLYVLKRIIATIDWEGSPPWWSDVQQILFDITDVVSSVYDIVVDVKYGDVVLKDLFRDVIGDVLKRYNVSSDSLAGFLNSTIQESKIPDVIVLLMNPEATIDAYCNGEISLDDFLTTEGAVNKSMLRNALCTVWNGTSFLEALLSDFKAGRGIPEIMQFLNDLFQPIAPDLNLGSLINQTREIFQEIDLLPDFIKDLPSVLTALNATQLAPLLDLVTLFQNQSSVQEVLIQMLIEGTTVVEGLFTQYAFWPIIQEHLAFQCVILDAQIAVIHKVIDGALVEAFKDDPFTQVGELFLEFGPNITEAILSTFLDPTKIEELMSLSPEEQQLVLCSDFIEYPPGLDVTYAQEELCKLNLTELYPSHVDVWASYFPEVVHAIEFSLLMFGGYGAYIPPEILGNATFKNVINKQMEYQELLTSAFQTQFDLKDFFAGLTESINVTGTPKEWNAMINRLTTNSLPALQESVLIGEWESVLDYIGDIPEVHSFIAAEAIEDIIIQDINIILSLFNSLSRGEVPAYGGETEKLLDGIVFMTQQGNAIQAAILEAYQDPVKSLVLGTTDITQVLCNATLRDSLLDLTSVDIDVLDSSLCNLNFDLLINETFKLMQIEDLRYLVYYIKWGLDYPLDLNLTAVAVHTNELVKNIGELDESWQNWIELVVNGSDWLSLAPQFTPQRWMDTWNTMFHMASYENWTALFQDIDPRNLTILIEDLVTTTIPGSEIYLHKIATMEVAVIQAMYGANNAFKLLQDLSRGYVSTELRGTQVADLLEFVLRVDLLQLSNVLSKPEVIGVVSQVGIPSLFCNAAVRDVILDLPGKGIDTSYFDRTICSVDFETAAQELYALVNGSEVEKWLQLAKNATPDEYLKPSELYWDSYTTVIEGFVNNLANVGGLVQDLGEQFEIRDILAYYEKQWLTELIGVNPTNHTDWDDLLKKQLTMVWEDLDKSLADIPGWDQYRTNVYLILSAIEQITTMNATAGVQPFTLASIVPNVTEFIVILREIPNLTDDIIYQLIYAPIDPVKLIELASTNSWNATLCNAELLSGVFINPEGLNLTQLQGALCAIDFEALIGQLSQATGIEHLVSMIIDQITSFNGGDDLGIGDYDPAQWASRIEQLIQSFDAQNIQGFIQSLANEFMMIYEDIDSQLGNVTGWLEFKADLTILMSVLQYTTPFLGNGTKAGGEAISLSMLVPNATELEILLAQNTPLSPDTIQALLNTALNPRTIIELALSNDWNATLCTEEGLMMLFVWPEGLNLTEIQGVVCSVYFKTTLMELMQEGAVESIIALIIDQFYVSIIPEFTLPDVDFTFLKDIIPQILSMIQTGDTQNITQLFESLNSLSAMFANETWYQDTIKQLQFMDFITKTFTDKIIMLEGRTITFPNLGNLLANSSELQRILLEDYQVGLGLVEALMTLSLQPDKLITFFNMTNPLFTLCATGQFSSFFYSPLNPDFNVTSLEEAVCKLDGQQLVMELKDLVSLDEILEQIQVMASNNGTGSYNWTAGYVTDERLSQAITQLIMNPPKLSFDEVWVNKTLETLLGLADRWAKAQERLGAVPSDLASSFDGLAELVQQGVMANQSWALETASALRTMNAVLDYTNDKLWALPGRNITLEDLLPPDIASHIEANSDLTPDMIALLLGSYVNTGALVAVNSTWLDVVCSDPQDLRMMFQVPSDVDLDAAYQALCAVDFDQWTLAYMQEIQNILIEIESGKEVNFTSITQNFQRLAMGIQALIDQPPTLMKYNEEWFKSIIQRTGAILKDTYNETQFLDPNNLGMMLNEMWLQIAASNPSLLVPARMNDYITQVLIDLLDRLPGQTYTIPRLDELFGDTTYVRELLSHSDIAPEIIDTFMALAVEQDKIVYLINTSNVFVELCRSGQFSTFFQLPPDSPTDITTVEDAVCSTNLTLVLAELDQKFKFTEIKTQIERILANDPTLPPFNQTAASLRTMEFSNLITALIQTPPKVTVDPVWWENVYNRSEVIVLQWLQRLTEQAMNGSSVPGLDTVLAQLGTLDIPGFDVAQLEMWIQQSQTIQRLITQAITGSLSPINGSATNETTGYILPILQELFPDPGLIRELLNLTGLPEDVREIFLQTIPQIQKWLPMLTSPDPLRAVCDGGLFRDIFLLTNTSIDIQAIEDQICSLNLTDVDGVISQIFMSDFDALVLELLQMFHQVPGLDLQTALNVSREISGIISSLISDPASFELNPQRIIELLQSLQVPGLNQTWVQDWYKQVQLTQYINDVISNWVIMNNGTELALPTFNELFPDPSIIVELLTDLGVPTDVTAAFLEMAIQADQWTELWLSPNPLQAVCNSSLFQDIFTQTLNSSVDIQIIQDTLCSLNLSNVDAILNDIFKTNPIIIQLVQMFYRGPGLDLQTALNASRELSGLLSSLISDPTSFEFNPQSIIELLQSLQVPGLNQTWVQDWYKQVQLTQYINDVISNWVIMNNGTEFALPTFTELFPDPSIIVELLTDLGVPTDVTAAFLEMAVQADQWTELWLSPDPLQAVCNSSLFQDIFTQTLNSSVDIQTIQDTLCSLNLSNVDAILNDIFKTNPIIIQLLQMFYQVPGLDLQTALNISREISGIISSLISDPASFELNPQSIIELLQSLQVPGLNQTWIQDWYKQVQLTQYINDAISNWIIMKNGTKFALPTFTELFPDPSIIVELLTDLGVPTDVTAAFLEMAIQADQWTELWLSPDPLQAVCNSSLFQDIFTQTLNSSVDIQTIQDMLCSLNLSNVDAILNDIFKTNPVIIQLVQMFYQGPGLDLQTALNVSREISRIISSLISDPASFDLNPQSIIELLQSLQVPGLNQTWVQDWYNQVQLMQYINDVISNWIIMNNGTEFALPTFTELFPDPSIIVELLTDLGVPTDITAAFLEMAVQADQWTELWLSPDPLQAVCNSSLFQDIFTQTLNSSVDIQTIQDTLCSLNLSNVDAILNDIFKTNPIIIQISILLFNDPTMDWETAWNTSLKFSQMFEELFQNPPVTDQGIKQVILSVFSEVESMLRMYGAWDETEHFLKYAEVYLQAIGYHLDKSNNFLKDLFDPTVSLDNLVGYVGLSPEEIKTALLGDITNLFLLADLYYLDGDWNYLFQCDNKEEFEARYNSSNDGFLDQFAVREAFCSLNISEFLESAKNLYGFDFLRLTELGYIRGRNGNSSSLDIESLVDLASDIAQMITDLASLPAMLTQDLDLDFVTMRLANLSTAISAQDYEQLIVLLDELAPLLNSPDIVNQIRTSLMSGTDIVSWFESINSKDPVLWLERIEGALNETLLWYTILPALNFVDLLIEADFAALNPLGYKYYDLITNGTVLQQYLTEILGLAPEYAEAITLSGITDLFVLADHHLSGTWETTYCIMVDPADSTHFNMTAVYSLLCNLDRDQFFDSASTLMGIDVLGLAQWIGEVKNPGGGVTQRFDWQTLVGNVESNINMLKDLSSIGEVGGINVTQVGILIQKLQQGIMQFDYEVLIEQMELLNQILYLNGQWDEVKGHMNTVTTIVVWLNLQLDNAQSNNVTLVELVTHHAMALQNLYYALGSVLFPQLVTALVDPQQAMTLQSHNDIETVVCDADSFNDLLKPTVYNDTTSLQGSLCDLLMSGHPTIANDLMTHFNIAPLEHEIIVLATNNSGQGFQDQDLDMRHMINEFEKLSTKLLSNTFNGFMHNGGVNGGLNATMLPAMDINTDDVIMMISGALVSSLPAIPLWNETIYPILGRLDLAMTMVQDLFFSLPGREAEIQAVLDNATIVNDAIPVILMEVPKVITAWNEVMKQPMQIPVLSKFILELLTGSLEGISGDPSYLIDLLTPANSTNFTATATPMIDLIVSLDRILLTEFGQQLMDVFRIRENAERLDIITDPKRQDLQPFDAYFIGRTQGFIANAIGCSKYPSECIIELHAPATLELLIKLGEVASQLPVGSLESLGDVFNVFAPILEEFIQQAANGTSELEKSLSTAFSFLMTSFEANKVRLIEVLSIFELEGAILNSSSVYQFLRENTDLTDVDFMAIKNGSINTTVLFELLDLGTEDSINLLCHKALINDLFINVDPNVTAEIVRGVCSNGTFIAVDFLRDNLDLRTVIELINKNAETTFPEFILEMLSAIGNLPNVDYEALGEFATIVVPALFENGIPTISDLDSIAENINITSRALKSIDALMTAGEDLFQAFPQYKDVQQLVRTLRDNLYIIELLAEFPDLSVRNILENEVVLEDYLAENTELKQREARDITYSTFDLEELFLTELAEYLQMLCDPAYLSTILIFPNQTNATILADTMCGLSGNDIATLLDTLLPFVDVSAIVNVSYMADSFGDTFSISNATIMQVMRSIASLEAITMALPSLQDALSNFNDDPAVEKLREIAELGFYSGEEVSAVTQEIMCGTTSGRKRRDADENEKIKRYKRTTVSENSDDFCQNIFSSLVQGVDGRLVWAYLKPIVEGRILYSPDNAPVRRIIAKANKTFEDIAMTQRFADVWLTSGGDLGTVLDPETLDATKALLENSYVQGLLEDQYGISADQFTDVLDGNLASMQPEQLQTLNLLAELVSNLTRCFNLHRFEGFDNEDDMVRAARNLDEDNTLLAALAFDITSDATELPAHIKYKIRMDTDNTPPTDRLTNRYLARSSGNSFVFDLRYLRGYIMLQDMIEGSIVSLQASPDLQPPGVYLQMTPYPCFLGDDFTDIFSLVLPLVMTISFVVLIGVMTYQLVYEKERGIEELLKVMGLPGGANWWAWFISNSIILILLSALVTLILKFGNVLPNIDWSLLLVFILDYFFSLIMFCYLASAVFQRASIASLASILVYSLFYLPYLAVFASEALLDTLWKPIVLSIFFPSTFSIGCVLMSQFEGMGVGAQWDLIWHNPVQEEVTSMAFILIALAVDGAIYLVLGYYIKTLFPGKYGVPQSWYFPLQPSFWCNCSISKKRDMTQYINSAYDPESGVALTDQGPIVEEEPSNHPLGMAILNLTKIYRSCFKQEKVAVDNLTLNFFEGQVTALLGHNGAGKTTTINIITGLFPASSGKVYLHGLNVAKQASVTRENLGVCVQHNALYDNLTVREHMALTGRVKGLTGKELDNDIYTLLEDVGLLKKSEEQVKNLSGGMKRKLSVAMAFVGHSTIVILDEPTSGVDPHARRAIWNLIMKHKTGRTIVLCTHFMDEADILGDRIAILDRGHLRCCGSPAFLKSRFSSGYRLSLTKEATSGVSTPTDHGAEHQAMAVPNIYDTMKSAISDVPSTSSGIATDPGSGCDTSQVTDFIKARIPTAMLQDDIGSELIYALPVEHGEREQFQELFEDLDNNLADLRIKSYGISDTTLKEVFLKVSTSRSVAGQAAILRNNNWTIRKPGERFTIAEGIRRGGASDNRTVLLNAWGIIIKRLHFVRRDWQGFIWTILMPVLMVALAIGFSELSQINREYQRQLTPAMFNPNSYAFFSDESDSDMGQRLSDALTNPPGLGTTCMADADQMDLYPCIDSSSDTIIERLAGLNLSSLSAVPEDQCQCTETGFGQECSPDAGGIPPPTWVTDTQVILQNITIKEDKDRYILDTQQKFRNSRFGGVSWFDVAGTNETQAKAWYNNRAYHAMPTFLNVMNNIILRATVSNNSDEYGITAYNHPLELSKQDLGIDIWLDAAKTFGIVLVIVTALVLIPSAFCMFLVTENVNGSKRLHYVSGVGTLTYWLTNLIWDMLSFCIPVGLMLVVLYIFNFRGLILASNIGAFVALVFLYEFAVMSQIYIFLSFFKEAGSAFIFFFCILLLESIITNLPNWLLAVNVVSETETPVFEILNYVLLVFSPFCLSSGLLALIQNQAGADIYRAFGVEDGIYEEPFQILKWHMVALAVEGVVAFLVLLIVDAVRNSNCSSCLDPNVNETPSYHDNDDVMEEKEMVLGVGGGNDKDAVILKELRKVYRGPGGQKIVAVNDLCLGVSKGECFGLLGVNGAGKTSTFRMITGDISPTEGSVKMIAKSVGYCPQENAMYPQLTGEELLYCYARMKGIHSSGMKKAISEICEELGMERYLRRRISTYSGGMKRSLAVAVALLGKPELILMDEPTTGMDPITKQKVLASVVNVIRDNRSVILTSHSMEECEAVCTRLAIMVNGQFCCLGSPQHVKNRHGNGYSLVVRGQKTGKSDMTLITEFVHRSFPGAELKEHHHNLVRYQLPPHNITVATIFGIMEREKTALNLEDYSVSQTTLDEVFVNFAKKQTDGLEDDTSSTTSAREVSIVNRAFEPDDCLDVDIFPQNTESAATQM